MQFYLVRLRLILGEYEKSTSVLVHAASEEEAELKALRAETHNEVSPEEEDVADWCDDWMSYRVSSVTLLTKEQYQVLRDLL